MTSETLFSQFQSGFLGLLASSEQIFVVLTGQSDIRFATAQGMLLWQTFSEKLVEIAIPLHSLHLHSSMDWRNAMLMGTGITLHVTAVSCRLPPLLEIIYGKSLHCVSYIINLLCSKEDFNFCEQKSNFMINVLHLTYMHC